MFSFSQAPSARAKSEIQKETYQTIRSLCVSPPVRPDLRRYTWALFFYGLDQQTGNYRTRKTTWAQGQTTKSPASRPLREVDCKPARPERQYGPRIKTKGKHHKQAGSTKKKPAGAPRKAIWTQDQQRNIISTPAPWIHTLPAGASRETI